MISSSIYHTSILHIDIWLDRRRRRGLITIPTLFIAVVIIFIGLRGLLRLLLVPLQLPRPCRHDPLALLSERAADAGGRARLGEEVAAAVVILAEGCEAAWKEKFNDVK